jgi:ParB family transcriptional regulator, chromosome partitioning protein
MVKKRGLGKSLDALLIGTLTATKEPEGSTSHPNEKYCMLPLTVLQRGKYQPRRGMNQEALEELANSIRAQGVIQPLVVRHLPGGRYEIVAGERRWRAAQMAGLTEIPAIVRTIPDEAAVAIALIENIQREGLNPIEESMALQRLMEEFTMTHQQVADAVGKSRATVTNLLRLLTLTEEVRTMVEQGDLEMGHARALLTLSPDFQIEAAQTIVGRGLSVREAEELVRKKQLPADLIAEQTKLVDPEIKRLQQDLTHKLHLKVAIQCNAKGKGKLVIQYNNHTELDKLLEFFE